MSKKPKIDNANIVVFSDRIAGKTLTQSDLYDHVLNELGLFSTNPEARLMYRNRFGLSAVTGAIRQGRNRRRCRSDS